MKPVVLVVGLALVMALACGDDGSGPSADDGEAGSPHGAGGGEAGSGAGGEQGQAGSGGTMGDGGTGGGGGRTEGAPCLPGAEEGACQACIAGALLSCTAADPACAEGFFQFSACAAEAGCLSEEGPDFGCGVQACPEQAMAIGACIATCPALRECAGL